MSDYIAPSTVQKAFNFAPLNDTKIATIASLLQILCTTSATDAESNVNLSVSNQLVSNHSFLIPAGMHAAPGVNNSMSK